MSHKYTMEQYSTIKKNEILPFATTWMNQRFSHSKSERERPITYDITCMWNLEYGTNEPIHKTETDSQTWKTDLWLLTGSSGEGVGWTGSLGLVDANWYIQNG